MEFLNRWLSIASIYICLLLVTTRFIWWSLMRPSISSCYLFLSCIISCFWTRIVNIKFFSNSSLAFFASVSWVAMMCTSSVMHSWEVEFLLEAAETPMLDSSVLDELFSSISCTSGSGNVVTSSSSGVDFFIVFCNMINSVVRTNFDCLHNFGRIVHS